MITVGTNEARKRLSELLAKAGAGHEVLITKRGRVVARLIGVSATTAREIDDAVERLRVLRSGTRLELDPKVLRDHGRR
jgi:prevent-host-death family protein